MILQALETGRIIFEEEFIFNSRGFKLNTCRWLPANTEPKALIFLCHGYAMDCSFSMEGTGTRLAKAGFGVYGIDYEGHGKSDPLKAYIPCFDDLVNDCSNHFTSICDDMKPPRLFIGLLIMLSKIFPKWKIIPNKDIIDRAIREPERRKEVRSNEYCYKGKIPLKTAAELYRVSSDLEKNLQQVSLPFIIVHGKADQVTDHSISRLLFESAESEEKELKLYDDMCHALTSGEPLHNINLVFDDIIAWLELKMGNGAEGSL